MRMPPATPRRATRPRIGPAAALATLLLASGAVLPPAAAGPDPQRHEVYYEVGDVTGCRTSNLATSPTCSVWYVHIVWSLPSIHCNGSYPDYTSCDVYHRCREGVKGHGLVQGTFSCSGVGGDACPPQLGFPVDCWRGITGTVLVARDTCVDFVATAQGSENLVSQGVLSDTFKVCVNRYGPYAG